MEEESYGNTTKPEGAADGASSNFSGNVFLNKQGLRSGWRLLVYVVVFVALLEASSFVLVQVFHPVRGVFSPWLQFSAELMSLGCAGGAAWLMSMIERRPMGSYGLPKRGAFGSLFWMGCGFGLVEAAVLMGVIAAFGGYTFGELAIHGRELVQWAIFWAIFFLVVGFFEEFLFRGYSLYTLADGVGFWPAAVVLSLVFGAVHLQNSGEDWIGAVGVLLVGLFWSFTLRRTGSLWFAVGMHAVFDFGETFLFSVPDSGMVFPGHLSNATLHGPNWLTGGAPGPEASVVDFLILAAFFLIFDRLYPSQKKGISGAAAEVAV